jgi:hypothetical protein
MSIQVGAAGAFKKASAPIFLLTGHITKGDPGSLADLVPNLPNLFIDRTDNFILNQDFIGMRK